MATPVSVLSNRKKNSVVRINRNSKIFKTIIKAIQEKKGENIVSLDLRKIHEKQIEKVVEKTPEKIVEQATENIEKMHVAEQNETSQKQQSSIQENSNNEKNRNLESEYLAKVKNKIEKNKVYPKVAKRLNRCIVTGKQIGRAHV